MVFGMLRAKPHGSIIEIERADPQRSQLAATKTQFGGAEIKKAAIQRPHPISYRTRSGSGQQPAELIFRQRPPSLRSCDTDKLDLLNGRCGRATGFNHPRAEQLDALGISVVGFGASLQFAQVAFDLLACDVRPEGKAAGFDNGFKLMDFVVNVGFAAVKAVPCLRGSQVFQEIVQVIDKGHGGGRVACVNESEFGEPGQRGLAQTTQPGIELGVGRLAVGGGNDQSLDQNAEPHGVLARPATLRRHTAPDARVVGAVNVPSPRLDHLPVGGTLEV